MEETSRRRHSAEDLNVELKSAASQTVEVFVAYARESSVRPRDPPAYEVEQSGATALAPHPLPQRPRELTIPPVSATVLEAAPSPPSPPLISPTSVVDSALQAAGVCTRPRSLSTSVCVAGAVETLPCASQRSSADAQAVARRLIAIGDSLETSYVDGLLEAANAGVPLQEIVGPFVRELTWENVVKLFRTAYRLIEQHCGGSKPSDGGWWTAFDELWDTILTDVSRWILQRGGWSSLLNPSPQDGHHTPPGSPAARNRIYSISESGVMVEDDEMVAASPSVQSLESSPGNNLHDSGVSLLNGSHGMLDTQGHNEDPTTGGHFLRHRSRSLPPNRRERRRSLRQSLDGTFVFRGALMVYHAVVEMLQK